MLRETGFQQMKDDLCILGIVLIPRVVHRFTRTRQRQRRDQPQLESLRVEKVGECPVVVAGGFKTDTDRQSKVVEESSEGAELLGCVLHAKLFSTPPAGSLDQRLVAVLGYIDGYPDNGFQRTLLDGHGRSLSLCEC